MLVLQGYGGDPPNGATQSSNAAKTKPNLKPDNELGSIGSSGSSLQIGTFASSTGDNTKKDILATINDFRKISPDGKLILVGHSQGGDNIVELASESNVQLDLIITLDIKDAKNGGIFSIDDNMIPGNVKNAINYYQQGETIGGTTIDALNRDKTEFANILSPGSNHRSIDNDLLQYIMRDINNFLKGKNAVKEAKQRKLPVFKPSDESPDLSNSSSNQ